MDSFPCIKVLRFLIERALYSVEALSFNVRYDVNDVEQTISERLGSKQRYIKRDSPGLRIPNTMQQTPKRVDAQGRRRAFNPIGQGPAELAQPLFG